MIKLSTFWAVSIVTILIITLLVVLVGIKKKKDLLGVGVPLLGIYIVIELAIMVMLTPIDTYYIDGRVVDDIVSIEQDASEYIIEVESGKTYNMSKALTSDKNFISFGCKTVNKNILGMELYKENDLLFVNVAKPDMSESEKEHMLDRIAPKN